MKLHEIEASLLLNALPTLGPLRYQKLINHFGTAHTAVQAKAASWENVEGFGKQLVLDIRRDWERARKAIDNELNSILRQKISILAWQQNKYPELLRTIFAPPPIIYVSGKPKSVPSKLIAVVGSRRCTYYGQKVAKELGEYLADRNISTISGMARGIDSVVHQATLNNDGETFAVLGCGLNYIYPPENNKLAEKIQASGALISEFPMNTTPFPSNFPKRNRIISGLSQATVVVEGGKKSGSLITAKLAAEQGREVYAVPGPIHSPLSEASHLLIQNGAHLLSSFSEMLEDLGLNNEKIRTDLNKKKQIQKNDSDRKLNLILQKIGYTPTQKDYLGQILGKTARELSPLLMTLEIKGLIKSLPGGYYVREK